MRNIAVTRSSMPPFDEYCAEIRELWDTHWLTNAGPKHEELKSLLKSYLGVDHLELFVNGHLALECALEALELSGEVITTPFTFSSTTHAIVRCGLTPVFCDIREQDYTLNPALIEPLITERTCAIIPVHVYGNVCDYQAIEAIARKYGLKVIYDAAHAFGETVDGKGVGALGDASMFSFHATKVFNTIEGGCVCYQDARLGSKLEAWRNFGATGQEAVEYAGGNAKMNEFAAAMGICNLRYIDEELEKRRVVAQRYREGLAGCPDMQVHGTQPGVRSNCAYFPVVFEAGEGSQVRDAVKDALAAQGYGARKYFYPLTSQFECYEGRMNPGDTPVARYVADRVLTLPMYADLALEDVDAICAIVKQAARTA